MIRKMMIAGLCLVAANAADAQTTTAVLGNGGFETGALSPWVQGRAFGGTTGWTVSSAFAHSGSDSAFVNGNRELRQDFAGIATSSVTDVSFWVMHPSGGQTGLTAYDFFYSDGSSAEFYFQTVSTGFERIEAVGNLAAGQVLTGFSVFGNSGGPTYLDDVNISAVTSSVPEPGLWAMTMFGIGAIGAALRRRRQSPTDRVSALA